MAMNLIALIEVPTVMNRALQGWGPEAPAEARRWRVGTRPPRPRPVRPTLC
jgi:hypothetical protein